MVMQNYFLRPAGQVNPTQRGAGLYYQGSAGSAKKFQVNCGEWVNLQYSQKISMMVPFSPWNPAGAVKAVDNLCALRGFRAGVLPAGQVTAAGGAAAMTQDAQGNWIDANGNICDSDGTNCSIQNPTIVPTTAPPATPSSGSSGTSAPTNTAASQASQNALYSTVGSALNTTGATIASIVASNNQANIAQLQTQTQQQIAALNVQAQQAQQQGNIALAQIRAQQAVALGEFNSQLLTQLQPQNTGLYMIGGLVALGVIGGIIYVVMKNRQ
jgi:hypothetical protein